MAQPAKRTSQANEMSSCAEYPPQDVDEQRRERRKRVADERRADRVLAFLHRARIAVGDEVADPADRQEERRERGEDSRDPNAEAVDDRGEVAGGGVGRLSANYEREADGRRQGCETWEGSNRALHVARS